MDECCFATCLLCNSSCMPDCDLCSNAYCSSCRLKINGAVVGCKKSCVLCQENKACKLNVLKLVESQRCLCIQNAIKKIYHELDLPVRTIFYYTSKTEDVSGQMCNDCFETIQEKSKNEYQNDNNK